MSIKQKRNDQVRDLVQQLTTKSISMQKSGLFFSILFLGLIMSSTANAQWNKWGKGIKGEGKKVTKTLDIDEFTGIGVSIGAEVHLRQGNKQKVEIKAQQNIIDLIDTEVRGGKWRVKLEKGTNLRGHDGIDVYITLPMIDELSVAGAGSIVGKTEFKNIDDLEVSIAGSGDVTLDGSGEDLEVSIAGSGDVDMAGFRVKDCEVSIAGSGDCEVNVDGRLEVSIAGSGDVKYKGDPDKVQSKIAGSGDVRSF